MNERIAVIGAGVGGLSAAARLCKKGRQVTIYEKLPRCGGRANIIEDNGFRIDTGPSFVLMPDFFREIFESCGEKIEGYLDLRMLTTGYRIFYSGGEVLNIYSDSERTKEELEKFESGAADKYDKFIQETGKIYKEIKSLLYRSFGKKDAFNPAYLPLLFKIRPAETYWNFTRRFFRNINLCYAFTFEAMFIGVSPFRAPAFYSVISYVDHAQKIFHPMGGMYRIPLALEGMAKKFGAKINYNSEVSRIQPTADKVVITSGEKETDFDRVLINADYAYSRRCLLGQKLPRYEYSCSVFLIYIGTKRKVSGLEHHNLFFAKDLRKNLSDIFGEKVFSKDLSFYVHVPTVTDPSLAPQGKDIVYILIPVPNLDNCREDIASREGHIKETVFRVIKEKTGIDLAEITEIEHKFYPRDFVSRYNIENGATFGLSHNLGQSAFFRPANRDPRFNRIYYAGASTQPGGGLPPVIAGSKIAADLIG